MIRKYIFRTFSVLAALLLTLPSFAQANEAAASGNCGTEGANISWMLDGSGTLNISGSGAMADYSEHSGAPWSEYVAEIAAVNVEEGVRHIGSYAFRNLRGLETVSLPQGLETIGSAAFRDCYMLQAVNLPEEMTAIGANAFACCYNLIELTLPSSITSIGDGAFDECFSLTVNVTENSYAHNWCITNHIPYEASGAPKRDFEYSVSDGQAMITAYNGFAEEVVIPAVLDGYPVTAIGANAFADHYMLQGVGLPETIAAIGENAFARCYNLVELSLPAAVAYIGDSAFDECLSLTVKVAENSHAHIWCISNDIPYEVIGAPKKEYEYTVTNGKATITAYYGCEDEVIIPSAMDDYPVTAIGANAFAGHDGVQAVIVPEGVTLIGEKAFARCHYLFDLTLPSTIAAIGEGAFDDCSNLTVRATADSFAYDWCIANQISCEVISTPKKTFEYTVTGDEATITAYNDFEEEVTIPETLDGYAVTAIGAKVFEGRYLLETVILPEGIALIGENAFARCYNLSELTLPSAITCIGDGAFDECSSLTVKVTANSYAHSWCIANNVNCEVIGAPKSDFEYTLTDGQAMITAYNGFEDEVTIPVFVDEYPVTAIGANVFADRYMLQGVSLPESIAVIGENAFARCYNLIELTLPSTVTYIGDGAFEDCWSLTVKAALNSYAHSWCLANNVNCEVIGAPKKEFEYTVTDGKATITAYIGFEEKVVIPDQVDGYPVTAIGANAFADQHLLQTLTLPESIAAIGESALIRCYNLCELNLPAGVASIGSRAFEDCFGLTVQVVSGSYAHEWCRDNGISYKVMESGGEEQEPTLHTLTLPSMLKMIDEYAFANISAEMIILPEGCISIGEYAFANNPSLQKIYMPDSVTEIADNAFDGCRNVVFICQSENAAAAFADKIGFPCQIAE